MQRILWVVAAASLASAPAAAQTAASAPPVDYDNDVKPLLAQRWFTGRVSIFC